LLRISKLADYGVKILTCMVNANNYYSATELADKSQLTQATVGKVLKLLAKGDILLSQRGSQGGYKLARLASNINLAEVVAVLDGEISITDCGKKQVCCEYEADCSTKHNWSVISQTIYDVLSAVSLEQMVGSLNPQEFPLQFTRRAND
jgi:FeS assembly SUF system regulator